MTWRMPPWFSKPGGASQIRLFYKRGTTGGGRLPRQTPLVPASPGLAAQRLAPTGVLPVDFGGNVLGFLPIQFEGGVMDFLPVQLVGGLLEVARSGNWGLVGSNPLRLGALLGGVTEGGCPGDGRTTFGTESLLISFLISVVFLFELVVIISEFLQILVSLFPIFCSLLVFCTAFLRSSSAFLRSSLAFWCSGLLYSSFACFHASSTSFPIISVAIFFTSMFLFSVTVLPLLQAVRSVL